MFPQNLQNFLPEIIENLAKEDGEHEHICNRGMDHVGAGRTCRLCLLVPPDGAYARSRNVEKNHIGGYYRKQPNPEAGNASGRSLFFYYNTDGAGRRVKGERVFFFVH